MIQEQQVTIAMLEFELHERLVDLEVKEKLMCQVEPRMAEALEAQLRPRLEAAAYEKHEKWQQSLQDHVKTFVENAAMRQVKMIVNRMLKGDVGQRIRTWLFRMRQDFRLQLRLQPGEGRPIATATISDPEAWGGDTALEARMNQKLTQFEAQLSQLAGSSAVAPTQPAAGCLVDLLAPHGHPQEVEAKIMRLYQLEALAPQLEQEIKRLEASLGEKDREHEAELDGLSQEMLGKLCLLQEKLVQGQQDEIETRVGEQLDRMVKAAAIREAESESRFQASQTLVEEQAKLLATMEKQLQMQSFHAAGLLAGLNAADLDPMVAIQVDAGGEAELEGNALVQKLHASQQLLAASEVKCQDQAMLLASLNTAQRLLGESEQRGLEQTMMLETMEPILAQEHTARMNEREKAQDVRRKLFLALGGDEAALSVTRSVEPRLACVLAEFPLVAQAVGLQDERPDWCSSIRTLQGGGFAPPWRR